jgi:hypothetical protein
MGVRDIGDPIGKFTFSRFEQNVTDLANQWIVEDFFTSAAITVAWNEKGYQCQSQCYPAWNVLACRQQEGSRTNRDE